MLQKLPRQICLGLLEYISRLKQRFGFLMSSKEYTFWLKKQFAEKLANQLMEEHGLISQGWTFGWNSSKRNFGICRYKNKSIELSSILTEHQSSDQIKDTIIHEIAHALTPGSGHGPKWKAMARKLGITPSRLGSLSEEGQEKMKEHAPWIMVYKDRVVKTFYKKPTRTMKKLPTMYLKSCPDESYGKLEIIPNPQYKRK